ncbi:MAG: DUF2268 domain-containing putative Zn-dependent protease [Methylobacterium sp.]|jgi:hypothetical protein
MNASAQQNASRSGITFHMLERGSVADAAFRRRLLTALEAAAGRAQARLPAFNVDIVVFENRFGVIPRIGVNGNSYYFNRIELIYDSMHPVFAARPEEQAGSTLVHELHHHARGARYGRSLGERLVSEGLACAFEEECGYETPFYAIECKGEPLRGFASRALAVLDRTDLNFANWMFGRLDRADGEFPYQCGYSLGYALAKAWLTQTNSTASENHAIDAEVVLKAWRAGTIQPKP